MESDGSITIIPANKEKNPISSSREKTATKRKIHQVLGR
jgi:hypothetical protein